MYIIMLIFNPVGFTQTLKHGGSDTRFFLLGSLQIFDLLVRLQFPRCVPRVILSAPYVANDQCWASFQTILDTELVSYSARD